jgi:hypothetical protein
MLELGGFNAELLARSQFASGSWITLFMGYMDEGTLH